MLAAMLNGVLAAQMMYYWSAKDVSVKEKEKREEIKLNTSPISVQTHAGRLRGLLPR